MLIPAVLVPDLAQGVPTRAVNEPRCEIGHGRSVVAATDIQLPPLCSGATRTSGHAADRVWSAVLGAEPHRMSVSFGRTTQNSFPSGPGRVLLFEGRGLALIPT